MALSPDPFSYTHPAANTWRNIQFGPRDDNILHYYQNTTRVAGGNPLLMIWHGGSREANEALSFTEGLSFGHYFLGYLLDSASYGTTAYFDVMSVEYSCHSHDRIPTSPYVEVLTYSGLYNCLVKSFPTYNERTVEDIQAANQWVRSNATARGINANKIVGFGHSMGGNALLCAALTPSRAWNAQDGRPFAARAESLFRGIVQWESEVDLSPWFMANRHTKNVVGFIQSDDTVTGIRGDLEQKYLIPDPTTGLYPSTVEKSAACKAMSPVDLIRRYGPSRTDLKIRSHYVKNFGNVSSPPPPYGTYAETVTPVTDYSTVPPYDAAGHDWRQFAFIEAACADAGMTHTGSVIDGADYPIIPGPPDWRPDLKLALEDTLAPTYAEMVAWVD